MSRIAYVNGRYLEHSNAVVHVEDRGYQFADGVYEVCEIARGFIIDVTRHLDRLERSLSELGIIRPMHRSALELILKEVVRRNRVLNGLVYLQITRGVARRDHPFPKANVRPAMVVTAKRIDPEVLSLKAGRGIKVITVPDNRWERVDIKTIGLLPNVLARQKAIEEGADDAWFVDPDGTVKEGSASNAWIVTPQGQLVTRPAESGILRGVTRTTVLDVVAKLGMTFEERPFTVEEATNAREAFVTSASAVVMPVVAINSVAVANGHPGSVSCSLRDAFFDVAEKTQP